MAPSRVRKGLRILFLLLVLVTAGLAAAAAFEMRTSTLQARFLVPLASELTWELGEGPSDRRVAAPAGPYDVRLGYARLPALVAAAEARGFRIEEQARVSERFLELVEERGLFPIYPEKTRAGLTILDRDGETLHAHFRPERSYPTFEAIPPIVWQMLLFIENRSALDVERPRQNPAVEWGRLFRSSTDLGLRYLGREGSIAGASTLATQIEKFRHSEEGLTGSPAEKLQQMATAALRAYLDGSETLPVRRAIVRDYINSVPLAAARGEGEISGIGDGLWAWFGADFEETNRVLATVPAGRVGRIPAPEEVGSEAPTAPEGAPDPTIEEQGEALRIVLSLLLSQRRPSHYLTTSRGREALVVLTDRHLGVLAEAGVISRELGAAARGARAALRPIPPERPAPSFVERKAANAVRAQLLGLLGVPLLYELDRLDLTVRTTVDEGAQRDVTAFLTAMHDPSFLRERGFDAFRLLDRGDPSLVVYSFLLHERTPGGNVVRVQTDNLDAPFNLNESGRLELGSTAKLRTLGSYLEVVEQAYHQFSGLLRDSLVAIPVSPRDRLSIWVRSELLAEPEVDLPTLLRRSMGRGYSASPSERFVTGGGVQSFSNFDDTYDRQTVDVTLAFQESVNLVFVRMMRDIVNHYMYRVPGSTAHVLDERDTPLRQEYLARFADREGVEFLDQFHPKYRGKTRVEILRALFQDRRLTPQRVAWAYRTVVRGGAPEELEVVLRTYDPDAEYSGAAIQDIFRRAEPSGQSLADLGFLASIHPLELWIAGYLIERPDAPRAEILRESAEARQEVYRWLFRTSRTGAQDQRIRALLEVEAFGEILKGWQRLGYPFQNIVASLGTSIGSSGDRPSALNDMVGIILNDGVRLPTYRVEELHFAQRTPYETRLRRTGFAGDRVMSSEVAEVLREAMIGVVEEGTGRRTRGAVRAPDGSLLPIGAKTGTGDNRYRVFAPGGRLLESRSVNRTSTLVFFIGDRYYGVVTAYVPGAAADAFRFTSALPAQILRELGPIVEGILREDEGLAGVTPDEPTGP